MSNEELNEVQDAAVDVSGVNLDEDTLKDAEGIEEAMTVSESSIPDEFVEIARKYKAHEALADNELDLVADTAIEILRNMLSFFDADDADIDEYDGGDGELILDVSNSDLAILIGRHGKTLEAFQYLFTALVNSRLGFRYPVMVDIEGYRNRRRQKLEGIARAAANKVLSRGGEVRMHPMKPYERRIIHLALRKTVGISTHSEGIEPNRYVVVTQTKSTSKNKE